MGRKAISKKTRQAVYDKYDGHCAYCGCKLLINEMQVDHISSVFGAEYNGMPVDNGIDNYNPSCRQCNFYKGTWTLEAFRNNLTTMMMQNLKHNFNYRMALKYGLIEEHINPVIFYFEKAELNHISETTEKVGDCETCKHYGDARRETECDSCYEMDKYKPYIPKENE